MQIPKQGEKYKHFKGDDKIYEIVAISLDCEDSSKTDVIYKQLYTTSDFPIGTIWKRLLEDFIGYKELPSKIKVKRFTRL